MEVGATAPRTRRCRARSRRGQRTVGVFGPRGLPREGRVVLRRRGLPATALLAAGLAGCAAPAGSEDPAGAARIAVHATRDTFPLLVQGRMRRVVVTSTITNRSRRSVYLLDLCPGNGTFLARLERRVGDEWAEGWAPAVCNLEYRPPLELKPGRTFLDTAVAYQIGDLPPRFTPSDIPGSYRAVYNVGGSPVKEPGRLPRSEPLPLPERTSNPFVIAAGPGNRAGIRVPPPPGDPARTFSSSHASAPAQPHPLAGGEGCAPPPGSPPHPPAPRR